LPDEADVIASSSIGSGLDWPIPTELREALDDSDGLDENAYLDLLNQLYDAVVDRCDLVYDIPALARLVRTCAQSEGSDWQVLVAEMVRLASEADTTSGELHPPAHPEWVDPCPLPAIVGKWSDAVVGILPVPRKIWQGYVDKGLNHEGWRHWELIDPARMLTCRARSGAGIITWEGYQSSWPWRVQYMTGPLTQDMGADSAPLFARWT
jgi:hypothetical protein